MKLLNTLFISTLIVVSTSCNNQDDLQLSELTIDRLAFVEGLSKLEQKEAFSKLNFSEKRDLWINKLDQVLLTTIEKEKANNILVIISQLKSATDIESFHSNKEIERSALSLAEITPQEEFFQIFGDLEDYKPSEFTELELRPNFSQELKNSFNRNREYRLSSNHSRTDEDQPKCNCDWTCGDSLSQCTHSKCEPTSSGCGFLWLFSCEERDELVDSDCP